MPKLTITVTQEDIDNGTPGDSGSCPIALAIQRVVPGAEYVEVDGELTWNTKDGPTMYVELPEEAETFVADFDAHRTVFPIEFECDPEPRIYPWDENYDDEVND